MQNSTASKMRNNFSEFLKISFMLKDYNSLCIIRNLIAYVFRKFCIKIWHSIEVLSEVRFSFVFLHILHKTKIFYDCSKNCINWKVRYAKRSDLFSNFLRMKAWRYDTTTVKGKTGSLLFLCFYNLS